MTRKTVAWYVIEHTVLYNSIRNEMDKLMCLNQHGVVTVMKQKGIKRKCTDHAFHKVVELSNEAKSN